MRCTGASRSVPLLAVLCAAVLCGAVAAVASAASPTADAAAGPGAEDVAARGTPAVPATTVPATTVPEHAPAESGAAVVYRVRSGAELDIGWTGIAHDQPWAAEQRLRLDLRCPPGTGATPAISRSTCSVTGGERGEIFGAPIPLSSGGIPVCVVNRLREPVTGTVNTESGCGELRLELTASVFTAADVARPCPVCSGDVAPNDGRKDGRCDGGPNPGAPCDVHAASALSGATSNDCQPAGSSVGELAIDLLPLTTGIARARASTECKRKRSGPAGQCFCAGQAQANDCDAGACGASESCDEGPVDGVCSQAPFRGCRPGTGNDECGAVYPGAGSCENRTRHCFRDEIVAEGACDPVTPTYVAVFCAPATRASAVNSTAGLPGPARLRLLLERVRSGTP